MNWLSGILVKNQRNAETPPSQPVASPSAEELQKACEFVEQKLQGFMSRNEPEKSYWDLLMKESRELHNFPLTPQKYIRNAIKTTLERVGVALTNDTSASTWFTLVSVEMHDADKSRNIPSEPSR